MNVFYSSKSPPRSVCLLLIVLVSSLFSCISALRSQHESNRLAFVQSLRRVASPPRALRFASSTASTPTLSHTSERKTPPPLYRTVAKGVGMSVPKQIMTNKDLEKIVETSDDWIKTRTGIGQRRVLDGSSSLTALAKDAGSAAVAASGVDPSTIDLVVLASSTPDDLFGDASAIAGHIGAQHAVAFDLTAACSGFLFATVTAHQYLQSGGYRRALVVGADALSKWVDWNDRNTCILFGDGAGAVVLEAEDIIPEGKNDSGNGSSDTSSSPTQRKGILGYALKTDGKRREQLTLGYNATEQSLKGGSHSSLGGGYGNVWMNGREVFKFATREVPAIINEALAKANLTIKDVDHFVLHQANIRILDAVAERLGVERTKLLANLDKYGNTSAASIPLMLAEAVQGGTIKEGDTIVLAGFGAGLSWGALVMRW